MEEEGTADRRRFTQMEAISPEPSRGRVLLDPGDKEAVIRQFTLVLEGKMRKAGKQEKPTDDSDLQSISYLPTYLIPLYGNPSA